MSAYIKRQFIDLESLGSKLPMLANIPDNWILLYYEYASDCWQRFRWAISTILAFPHFFVVAVQSLCRVWLCNPMDCSMPVFPILHYLLEFAQTHVHWVSDAIQPSPPVPRFSFCLQSFPALESLPVSWLFTSSGQSIGASASVLPVNIQGWFPLGFTSLISLLSKGLSRVFSSAVRKHRFFSAQPSL